MSLRDEPPRTRRRRLPAYPRQAALVAAMGVVTVALTDCATSGKPAAPYVDAEARGRAPVPYMDAGRSADVRNDAGLDAAVNASIDAGVDASRPPDPPFPGRIPAPYREHPSTGGKPPKKP